MFEKKPWYIYEKEESRKNSTEKAFYQCHFNDFMYEVYLNGNWSEWKTLKAKIKKTPLNVLNYTIFQALSSSLLP